MLLILIIMMMVVVIKTLQLIVVLVVVTINNLQDNNLPGDCDHVSGLERTVFSSVGSLTSLNLDNNPLHCDCRLSWLATFVLFIRDLPIY